MPHTLTYLLTSLEKIITVRVNLVLSSFFLCGLENSKTTQSEGLKTGEYVTWQLVCRLLTLRFFAETRAVLQRTYFRYLPPAKVLPPWLS